MPKFTFDVTGVMTVNVDAPTLDAAQALLNADEQWELDVPIKDGVSTARLSNFSIWHDGMPTKGQGNEEIRFITIYSDEGDEYTADIDTVVDCGPKGEKAASQLTIGDVFKDFGDSDDEWKRVVADNSGEGDTVILRVVDAPSPDPAVAAAATLSNAALVAAAGEAKALNED